ncbi:MAG: TadE/TadG family type IV pilus assembly protein [Burkholderiaceae bacterium]
MRSARRRLRGAALVELALLLPLLLLLTLGVVDFSRAIQYNTVLVNLSREGANLSARTTEAPESIFRALVDTATPLAMNVDGIMYITRLVGRADGRATVAEQYRPAGGGKTTLPSRIWDDCPAWSAGRCAVPESAPVITLAVALREGETVFAVEAIYDYRVLTRYVFDDDPRLYSVTIL